MSEEGDTGSVPISSEIPRLAEIFVRFDQALNPESRDAKVAEVTFERETDEFYARLPKVGAFRIVTEVVAGTSRSASSRSNSVWIVMV